MQLPSWPYTHTHTLFPLFPVPHSLYLKLQQHSDSSSGGFWSRVHSEQARLLRPGFFLKQQLQVVFFQTGACWDCLCSQIIHCSQTEYSLRSAALHRLPCSQNFSSNNAFVTRYWAAAAAPPTPLMGFYSLLLFLQYCGETKHCCVAI